MNEEIQLQKPNSNIYCYCNFVARRGKIVVECQTTEFSPETEENTNLKYREYPIEEFVKLNKKWKWIVC